MLPSEFKAIKILAEALRAGLSAIKESLQNQEAARKHSEEAAKQKLGEIPWPSIVSVILDTNRRELPLKPSATKKKPISVRCFDGLDLDSTFLL